MTDFVNNITNSHRSSDHPSPENLPLEVLIALCHHRWSFPIISELHRRSGAKFVSLVNRLNISRDALSRTLQALQDQDFVKRNPGYGHPLRPEYILTTRGERLSPAALELITTLQHWQLEDVVLKKWALPIINALEAKPMRFGELRQLPLTARALSLTLKELELAELIEGAYQLTERGQRLGAVVSPLRLSL
jgi:DNA-binding HxlR family transcriptional regulator